MESLMKAGSRVLCKWKDGNFCKPYSDPAQIIQERFSPNRTLYIHYLGFNKRLDRWVSPDQITPLPPSQEVKTDTMVTRYNKRKREDLSPGRTEQLASQLDREHEQNTKVRNIDKVILGKYQIQPWYYSPYLPKYYHINTLYICEFCLKYMRHGMTYRNHLKKCQKKKPCGKLIYKQTVNAGKIKSISVYEIIGSQEKLYCQNFCLLAKLFLDHKTLYYYVSPFKFYVMTEDHGKLSKIVGYFSKEVANDEYNLACILVLPPYQQRGYGKFMIALSYELSKREKKIGTPERPLSDMGRVSYRSYWTDVIMQVIRQKGALSIKEISQLTSIAEPDVIDALNTVGLAKYWKGQYIINTANLKVVQDHFIRKEQRKQSSKGFQAVFNSKKLLKAY